MLQNLWHSRANVISPAPQALLGIRLEKMREIATMTAGHLALQREFKAYRGTRSSIAGSQDFIDWLHTRREDAINDWRRLQKRVSIEQLKTDRQAKEIEFLEDKYGRYFRQIGIEFLDNHAIAPWNDPKEKHTKKHPRDDDTRKCYQPQCQRPLPASGSSLDCVPPQCGICAAGIDAKQLAKSISDGSTLYKCAACGNDICISCGRGFHERQCRTCQKVVGVPPSAKLAQSSKFCCWACESDQEARRQEKLVSARRKGQQRDSFRCGECTTAICVECAKPVTYKFDPDYGFIRNWWYKFVDNIWDPPELHGGFEKYLRRESRMGIPQFNLEDLYVPGYKVDPNNNDMSLYENVAPPKSNPQDGILVGESQNDLDGTQVQASNTKRHYAHDVVRQKEIKKIAYRHRDCMIRRVEFGLVVPPPQGYDDSWYAENNRRLYDMAANWSETYFSRKNFPEKYNGKTWLLDLNEQFVQYANIVAHEDPFFGPRFDGRPDGWEHILRDRMNRKWLVVGILAQIIEKKIFVELLFGATPEQAKQLEKQDRDNITKDGRYLILTEPRRWSGLEANLFLPAQAIGVLPYVRSQSTLSWGPRWCRMTSISMWIV
jgi:hypothetical protein